ncbi:hypothetical protein N7462_007139 [Penicillium macrosclerotiorum]|uniref:uncharacterized protein n=1 Tax=Penicillium macrosclerotiorum TaxID=303699 RepID=UPI002546EC3B|nr:uncharacterized protein N7462_007139 [Penicillium macrosclerotiorum]KAJ5678895.1 hypothetical protein N7462_007139 [Penicillium macrosclerotiorum]
MAGDLEAARIVSLPADAFYIANFISKEEEELLLQKIASAPLPRWTHLSHRRLQTWPSPLTKSNALLASPLPGWLVSPIIEPRFTELRVFHDAPHHAPNHVLVNEYRPGQGIMPHEDGAAYHPLVATVSLGAPIVLDLYEKKPGPSASSSFASAASDTPARNSQFRVLQERRSLLITRGRLYTDFLHGIAETTTDRELGPDTICNWSLLGEQEPYRMGRYERQTRTSLTFRDVLKVAKIGNTAKFLSGR